MNKEVVYATGKKKCSCARVFLRYDPVNNFISINSKSLDEFPFLQKIFILQPFNLLNIEKNFFIKITTKGGGFSSRLVAIRHGISKALIKYFELTKIDSNTYMNFRKILRKENLLTRDSRIVERKKFGYKKSRKKEQYSKR